MKRLKGLSLVAFVLLIVFTGGIPQKALAEMSRGTEYVVFDPVLEDSSITIDSDAIPPEEPNILQVTFLKIPDVPSVEGRIDRLLQGITVDLPPEFDHYGYEIRRYMSRIGNAGIYEDDKRLIEEIANVKKARVIVSYWQKALDKEMKEIDLALEKKPATAAVLNAYKQNKSTVRSFLVSLQGWVDSNERFLTYAYETKDEYENYYPEIVFTVQNGDIVDFYNAMLLKQTKLKMIRKYPPFTLMVY